MPSDIKRELLNILTPIFGEEAVRVINNFYDENDIEIVELSRKMLTGYFGEERAERIMLDFLKRFPLIKVAGMKNE